MELFKSMTGTQMVHIPYKGTQMAVTDILGGQIKILCDNLASLIPLVQSGRLRALAVTAIKRSAAVPDLPTLDASGLPCCELTGWLGVALTIAGEPAAQVGVRRIDSGSVNHVDRRKARCAMMPQRL